MSATATLPPPAIKLLAERLGIAVSRFEDESDLGRRGFFRYGHRTNDACRYCLEDGRIIGLCIRGEGITDLDWMTEEAFADVEDLYFGENDFTALTIPANWTKLRRVDLSRSPRLRRLTFAGSTDKLERLEIRSSGLLNLTLPACPALEFLDLNHCEIRKLTIDGPCSSLHSLHLRAAAQLETLEINGELPALHTLELVGCEKLRKLPVAVILDSPLDRLYLDSCMPRNCPSYLCTNESLEGVRVWFRELAKGSDVNKRVKLLISGNGDVGKSTIQCALTSPEAPPHCSCADEHESTHGILIGEFEHDDITFSYWDFGGQDVYGATHRLFFADQAVQLLVFDPLYEKMARSGEEGSDRTADGLEQKHEIQYYHAIQQKKSKYDTFVIVQNKYDKIDAEGRVDYAERDEQLVDYAQQELSGRFLHIDALTGLKTDELLETIVAVGKQLPRYKMAFPTSWLAVRQWFIDNDAAGTDKRQRITAKYFAEDICAPKGVTDEGARKYLLEFLESAGYCYVINNASDEDGAAIIVDQEWALRAVYRPLHRKEIGPLWERLKGRIPVTMIYDTFGPEYGPEDKKLLLNFMVENRLCFPSGKVKASETGHTVTTSEDYIFPAYLEKGEPEVMEYFVKDKEGVLHFRAKAPFLNRTDFQGFLCRVGRKVDAFKHLTRDGIFLKTEEGGLGARINYSERCYEVFCARSAAGTWLKSLLEECPGGDPGWVIVGEGGEIDFDPQTFFGQFGEREEKDLTTDLLDRISSLVEPPIDERMQLARFKQELELLLTNNDFNQFFPRLKEEFDETSERYTLLLSLMADYNEYLDHQIQGDLRSEEALIRRRSLRTSCFALTRRLEVEDITRA